MNVDFDDFIAPQYKKDVPNNMDMIYYIFWKKGVDYNKLVKLPIPYILSIMKTYNWVKKEEEKATKKANKK